MNHSGFKSATVGVLSAVFYGVICAVGVSASSLEPPEGANLSATQEAKSYSVEVDGETSVYFCADGKWITEDEYVKKIIPEGKIMYSSSEELTNALKEFLSDYAFCTEVSEEFYFAPSIDYGQASRDAGIGVSKNVYDSYGELYACNMSCSGTQYYRVLKVSNVTCTESHGQGFTRDKYEAVMAVVKEEAARMNEGTDAEKVKKVYDYLCDTITYDEDLLLGDPYDALISGKSVCSGYQQSFQLFMEELGIPCKMICGRVDGTTHGWNAVLVDGEWYQVDATFGDTTGKKSSYLLFGTNRRADVFQVGLAELSHQMVTSTLYIEASKEPEEEVTERGTMRIPVPTDKPVFEKEEASLKEHWIAIIGGILLIIVGISIGLGVFRVHTKTKSFVSKYEADEDYGKKKKHSKKEE